MVLVGPHEYHGPLRLRDVLGEPVRALERLGDAKPEQAHERIERVGRAGAAEEHDVVVRGADRSVDHAARLLPQLPHDPARGRHGCVGVRVK